MKNLPVTARRIIAFLLIVACLPLVWQRLTNLGQFAQFFGEEPSHSDLNDWMREIKLPHDAMIISGIQSYIPASFEHLYDNQWQPPTLDVLLYQNHQLPVVLIEDDAVFSSYFSNEIGQRGFHTPEQKKMHAQGQDFYLKLKANRLFPYVLASRGKESTWTHNLPPHKESKYNAYVNRYAFAENILARSQMSVSGPQGTPTVVSYTTWKESRPDGGTRSIVFHWNKPTSLSLLHLTTSMSDAPPFVAEVEDAGHGSVTLPFISRSEYSPTSTERFLQFNPTKDVSTLTIKRKDGAEFQGNAITDIRAYAPAPCGLNTTKICVDLQPESPRDVSEKAWENLLSTLPQTGSGVVLAEGRPLIFTLVPRMKLALRNLTFVFDAVESATITADSVCVFEDGSEESLRGALQQLHNPDASFCKLECRNTKAVRRIQCRISTDGQNPPQIHLSQVSADVEPLMP